ncbi:hypothetical protein J6590_042052 [Homalodisca vitripennis]|nr:hypothetical protein J6590_042052 [Homalodisca vitripennis]
MCAWGGAVSDERTARRLADSYGMFISTSVYNQLIALTQRMIFRRKTKKFHNKRSLQSINMDVRNWSLNCSIKPFITIALIRSMSMTLMMGDAKEVHRYVTISYNLQLWYNLANPDSTSTVND